MGDLSGLRKQLQTDDPTAPGNALETLAKAWANWRVQQAPTDEQISEGDVPVSAGSLTRTGFLRAVKDVSRLFKNELKVPPRYIRQHEEERLNPLMDNVIRHPAWWDEFLWKVGGKGKPSKAEFLGTGARADAYAIKGDKPEVVKFQLRNDYYDPTRSEFLEWAKNPTPGQYPYLSEMDVARLRLPMIAPTVPYIGPEKSMLITRQPVVRPYGQSEQEMRAANRGVDELYKMAKDLGLTMKDVSASGNVGRYQGRPVTYDLGTVDVSNTPKFMDWLSKNRMKTVLDTPDYATPPPIRNQWGDFRLGDTLKELFD